MTYISYISSREPIAGRRNPEKLSSSDTILTAQILESARQPPLQSTEELLNKLYFNSEINTTYTLVTVNYNTTCNFLNFVFMPTLIFARFWAKPRPFIFVGPSMSIPSAL